MDEKTIIDLISLSIQSIIRIYGSPWSERDEKEIVERIADTAWNGLILGLRETLSKKEDISLEEFGHFEKTEGENSWIFYPAESLIESIALGHDTVKADEYLVDQCLFFFTQSEVIILKILRMILLDSKAKGEKSSDLKMYSQKLYPSVLSLSKAIAKFASTFGETAIELEINDDLIELPDAPISAPAVGIMAHPARAVRAYHAKAVDRFSSEEILGDPCETQDEVDEELDEYDLKFEDEDKDDHKAKLGPKPEAGS